jgi:Holliday junction resolvase RusA-like endonuclease
MTAGLVQELVIPDWLPEQLANGQHGHWATRQKRLRKAQHAVWVAARLAGWQPISTRAKLTIVLVFPNQRRRDVDNLYARAKGLVDGVRLGGWVIDDDTAHLDLEVRAEVVPGTRETRIRLEEA